MRPIVRLIGLGALAYGVSRGWDLIQEWRFRLDQSLQAEADLIAARDLDAELVGERADAHMVSASGAPSPSRDRGRGQAASG
jgi:hypothetical protein